MKAIIYTTNTGSTAQYAKMLAEQTGLPAFSMEEAKSKVEAGSEIIYLGWIMAAQVKGYKAAAKEYKIKAVCAVGMGTNWNTHRTNPRKNFCSSCNSSFHIAGKFRCEKTARNLPPYDEPDGKNDNKKTWSKNRPHTAGK